MKTRAPLGAASLLVFLAVVATAVAQVAPGDPPPTGTAADAGGGTDSAATDAAAPGPDAATAVLPDAAATLEPPETADVAADEPEATAAIEAAADASPVRDATRVVQRRREAALVGGWVRSLRDEAGLFVVDDLQLAATGEWVRRQNHVDSQSGVVPTPAESSGTWLTEEDDLVLLASGSAVDEVLRAAYEIDDRSETLVLALPEGPASYYRYR